MTRIDSGQVKWRIQVRLDRYAKWVNRGLFETRSVARGLAAELRTNRNAGEERRPAPGFGFGNTRTVRHISGKGKAKCS